MGFWQNEYPDLMPSVIIHMYYIRRYLSACKHFECENYGPRNVKAMVTLPHDNTKQQLPIWVIRESALNIFRGKKLVLSG